MNLQITPMTLNDLEQLKYCLLEEFDDFWTFGMLEQELKNTNNLDSYYFVVKNNNNEILGFAGVLNILGELNIMNIVVRKSYRNLKIGSFLLSYIINFAKSHNITSITLEVNEKNLVAIALYKKFNFKQVGLRKKYYNNTYNAILMTLTQF